MITVQELNNMRSYFNKGTTADYAFRIKQLKILQKVLLQYEDQIYLTLKSDLNKSPEESWVTENGFVLSEIKYALQQLKSWMKPRKVSTNLLNLPSSSYIYQEPMGVVLIVAPWNYPLQLLLNPLVGAIAAGNVVVLKASEFAPATSSLLHKMISENFDNKYIRIVEGHGADIIPAMMNHFTFDHVFFTGSTRVGKLIYEMAAKRLVRVTLELGGKSPCVVEADANITVAARRIAGTKFSNAGQICVAPDYILVHHSVKDKLLEALRVCIHNFYGEDAVSTGLFGKIIDENHFDRLVSYLSQGKIQIGGNYNREKLTIAPTVLSEVAVEAPIMKEEIFGPILPIISFNTPDEALEIIAANSNPLAFYIFTSSKEKEKYWLNQVSCGGACVNNSSWHLTNHNLPFGGRGNSGMGHYHGKYSFHCFSHAKAVLKTPTWFDPNMKYPPLKGRLGLFKKLIG